jgi:quercetin dioxygenase-like cupin family protein
MTERKEAMHNMKNLVLSVVVFTFGFAAATHAQEVNKLLTKQLPEAPGKEIEVITVDYAPGAVDTMHRHDAHAVVYVLEGEIEMQVRGGTLQRLGPGQVFYESPQDVHTVSRNASKTRRAKFVVFFVKNQEAPILSPAGLHNKTSSDDSLFSTVAAFREIERRFE